MEPSPSSSQTKYDYRCSRCNKKIVKQEPLEDVNPDDYMCNKCESIQTKNLKRRYDPERNKYILLKLQDKISKLEEEIDELELQLITEPDNIPDMKNETYSERELLWKVPPDSVPICVDVTKYNFHDLINYQLQYAGQLFDCIMMDPPWQLASSNPTRGVTIKYSQLQDQQIQQLPIDKLCPKGLLFLWVINAKYRIALDFIEQWGFHMIEEISWVKSHTTRRIAKSHGFYLQHCKEICLVAQRGEFNLLFPGNGDFIYSPRRGQSQKPQDIYCLIEELFPDGYYLEIFGRRNNLRNGWVTIGNEL